MTLEFEQPLWLALALLIIPLLWLGWRAMESFDLTRRIISLGLRALLIAALAVMLAQPSMVREHHHLTVIGLLDISGSVRQFANLPAVEDLGRESNLAYLRDWFRKATQTKEEDDRFGLIVFDGRAVAVSAPVRGRAPDHSLDLRTIEGSNIADALRLGLAMLPADTAKRLVLVSDGNETVGDALAIAREAAGGASVEVRALTGGSPAVPIDVLPITYRVTSDIQIVRVESPPNAQSEQVVTVRVVAEATQPTDALLTLLHEGQQIDLNGGEPGRARLVRLSTGESVHVAQVQLGAMPVNRFEARLEAIEPDDDVLLQNNVAEAFTATPAQGSYLVLDPTASPSENPLAAVLADASLPVEVRLPAAFPQDLLALQGFDLVILDNVGAYDLLPDQQELLARYVHDLGGGLIMVGGEDSFGAGGWNNTVVEALLPLELDPPAELRLPSSALVLVLDTSGSMAAPVGGARASQQEVANEGAALAIESLRKDALVSVVTFDFTAHLYVPLQRNDDPAATAERIRAITPGGGTNIEPALTLAHQMLRNVEVEKKRVVCLSDGQSPNMNLDAIVRAMVADGINVTTIAVGDQADEETLQRLAVIGEGEFYPVRNPRILPRVLIDSVQVINKPLIKEGEFTPVVQPTGSTLTVDLANAPPLDGLVITAPRPEATIAYEMIHPDGEPLLAHWQVGLGRVAAFTSDAFGPWSRRWTNLSSAEAFWTQLARMTARASMSREAEMTVAVRDDRLEIGLDVLDAPGEEGAPIPSFLTVDGRVYRPDGTSERVRLRQVGARRYEAMLPADQSGNYIVVLSPRQGSRTLAPVIGGASRTGSVEFRRYRSNLALLEQIAEITRGRLLDLENPQQVNLFDRAGLPHSRSLLPAWRTVLFAALAFLLLDVASRRIAWSAQTVHAAVTHASARTADARERGAKSAATLARLRRRPRQSATAAEAGPAPAAQVQSTQRLVMMKDQVKHAQGQTAATAELIDPPAEALRRNAQPASSSSSAPSQEGASTPSRSNTPSEARVRSALDRLLGRTSASPGASRDKETPAPPPAPRTPADDEESRSSLLEAKRRARDRFGGGAP